MARPQRNIITQGLSSWDADVDRNFESLTGSPFPIFTVDTEGELPSASGYASCIALVSGQLFISTGTVWKAYNGTSTHQADSTATDIEGAVSDFNSLLSKLRASGIMESV